MLGFVSKRKLLRELKELKRIYLDNNASSAHSKESFYYFAGCVNTISALCIRLGINLNEENKREKTASVSFEVAVEKEGE